jgi:phage terminase large subunit
MKINLSNLTKVVNKVYWAAFRFKGRFLVLYGGSGSGKSWAIAQKIIARVLTEDKHNILCVRKYGNTLHKSCFALLQGTINAWGLAKYFTINEAEGKEKIVCKFNGNKIIFSGLDDTEKLKSIYDITSIWIEEASECDFADFRELNRRLRGYKGFNKSGTPKYMQFMISFNPISILHWLKTHFVDRDYKKLILSGEAESLSNSENLDLEGLIIHSTYKDNLFIDEAYKKEMEDLKEIDEYDYNVYALGLWGVVGRTFFKAQAINDRIIIVMKQKPIKQGQFEYKTYHDVVADAVKIDNSSIKWVDDENGCIKIYEEPKEGYPYVLGGDTAGEGSDWNTGQMLNNITDNQVATLRLNYDEDLFAMQMYCFGMYYNEALLAVETNFSTHPMKVLTQLNYPNQYIRESRPDSFTGKLMNIFGFNTNRATRPDALGILKTIVREKSYVINDLDTLYEMVTFIINEKGRAEAAEGKHDDLIMGLAIAHYIKKYQRKTVDYAPKKKAPEPWQLQSNRQDTSRNGGFSWS